MADPQYCLLAIDSWATCYTKAEWASWIQAVAASAALFASYRLARQSHLDAVERDRMAVERAKEERANAQRISIEHCVGLISRALEILRDARLKCNEPSEGSAYFRSSKANLQVIVTLMERRAMDSMVEYVVLRHVTSSIAAIHGTIFHLDQLVNTVDTHARSPSHFLSLVAMIPAQLDVCKTELQKHLDR